MRAITSVIAAVTLGLFTLAPQAFAQDKGPVGISMPTKSSARWIADGDNMVRIFKEKGYQTDLQYAEDEIPNQLAQIENMLTKGAKVLVIAAIDGTTLSDVLAQAASQGTKIIAYDRLIRGSANVDYYARSTTSPPPSSVWRSAALSAQHRATGWRSSRYRPSS